MHGLILYHNFADRFWDRPGIQPWMFEPAFSWRLQTAFATVAIDIFGHPFSAEPQLQEGRKKAEMSTQKTIKGA